MKTIPQANERETRVLTGQVELRAADGEESKPKVRGYAAVFGKESENLGSENYQFREVIEAGAFDDVLKDDVRALLNHDPNFILARFASADEAEACDRFLQSQGLIVRRAAGRCGERPDLRRQP